MSSEGSLDIPRAQGTAESQIIEVERAGWDGDGLSHPREVLRAALERGRVLYFSALGFALEPGERRLLDPALADPRRKNISLTIDGALRGVQGDASVQQAVQEMVARFAQQAGRLVDGLLPEYRQRLRAMPTSLRLHQVQQRKSSWRADDSRLHVDAFPSRPNRGERILRVFTNVNPVGEPRVWRVGEPFEAVAQRFVPRVPRQFPGSARLLAALRVTKSRRTAYDHLMLGLHDGMKADLDYQAGCAQERVAFPPGSVWVCFSDQTSHAVMSGQFMLEQTFFLPVKAMVEPVCSPLAILERQCGRRLI